MSKPKVAHVAKLTPRRFRTTPPPSRAQIDAMAESIRTIGRIVEPIEVRWIGDRWEIINGEVRWLAAKQLNIDVVPIQLISLDDHSRLEAALLINLNREPAAPGELIDNLEKLVSVFGAQASETILEHLPELRAIASDKVYQGRINTLLASCNIDSLS